MPAGASENSQASAASLSWKYAMWSLPGLLILFAWLRASEWPTTIAVRRDRRCGSLAIFENAVTTSWDWMCMAEASAKVRC